jgi:SNF2 family DNA or RNA helicase
MILSPRAAGTGLNITGANHVIHYTRWWNPAVEQQATDRVYRIGQEKEVNVYYPIMTADRETVEEKLHRLLEEKKRLAKNIIVPNNPIQGELMKEMNQEMV